jgi:hypothetical protein
MPLRGRALARAAEQRLQMKDIRNDPGPHAALGTRTATGVPLGCRARPAPPPPRERVSRQARREPPPGDARPTCGWPAAG